MSVLDAAYQALAEAGEPLHTHEITRRILERGLWSSQGKTPEATVEARLAVDVKNRGANSRFVRVGKRTYALAGAPQASATKAAPTTSGTAVPVGKSISFTDAAEQVLERRADRRPMHYREITHKALELGLLKTQGKTPEATMYAQILAEVQRRTRQGVPPRFTKHGRGYVGLSKWIPQGLAAQITQHNKEVHKKLHEHIQKLDPAEFETLIGRLLTALGFELVTVTSLSGDGGIDVRGTLVVGDVIRTRMAVQVKRWKANVQSPVVQQVRGSLGAHEQGLIITTSDFSKGARDEAQRPDATPVALMDGEQLVNLLIENDIGVRRSSHDLIELGEDEP